MCNEQQQQDQKNGLMAALAVGLPLGYYITKNWTDTVGVLAIPLVVYFWVSGANPVTGTGCGSSPYTWGNTWATRDKPVNFTPDSVQSTSGIFGN